MHGGHRERVRERFLQEGLSAFSDIQALELLLFYSIPRQDTNPLAHNLLERFGSLHNIFEADISDVASVEGIGMSSAVLIKLLPEMTRKFWIDEKQNKPRVNTVEEASAFIKPILFGKPVEHVYVFCLDTNYRVKHYDCISQGTINDATIYLRNVVQCAIRLNSNKILLAHNHPGGHPSPSDTDIKTTRIISEALCPLGIDLIDHIIFSGHEYYSFSLKHMIEKNYPGRVNAAQASYLDEND
ncbi:MAG: DNA repair protein RadC [Eubacteriales bacterium]